MNPTVPEEFQDDLRQARSLAIFSHISPDGDTVGAALALRLALMAPGREVQLLCDGEVPENLCYLPGADAYRRPADMAGRTFDTALAVDVSSPDMLGRALPLFNRAEKRLVIDHHASNPAFGDRNFIRRGESSCCLLAYETILSLRIPMDVSMGTCLLLGMSTDTGHFRYASTSPKTLQAAAELVSLGVDISDISRRMYRLQPMRKLRLMRLALDGIRYFFDDQVGVITLPKSAFDESGCSCDETEGLINLALEVEGVRMAFLVAWRPDGTKVSLRATEPDRVDDIALILGGGGHAQAAGCKLAMSLEEAQQTVLSFMRRKLKME